MLTKRRNWKDGKKLVNFYVKPEVAAEFKGNCVRRGLVMGRLIEDFMVQFNDTEGGRKK